MIFITEDTTKISVTGPEAELSEIALRMRFRPPDYWRSDAYQLFKISGGKKGWNGYMCPFKQLKPDSYWALRGHLGEVLEWARVLKFDVNTDNVLRSPFYGMVPDDIPDDIVKADFQLDQGQRESIVCWLSSGMGVNKMTVSAGKTVCFITAAALIKQRHPDVRILYITPTERLVNQVFQSACEHLPDWNITQYGGGKGNKKGTDMVVCTMAILGRNYKVLLTSGWFKSIFCVLYDESHHAQSPSSEKVLLAIPAYYRLGASDSTKEDDIVKSTRIRGLLGPVLNVIKADGLMDAGRMARPTIYLIDNQNWSGRFEEKSHTAPKNSDAWVLMDGDWIQATYLGPTFEKAEPVGGQYRPGEEDGLKRDRNGEMIILQNFHRLLINGEELEMPSRWCLLDRLYDRAIIRFKDRNELIARWAKYFIDKDYPTLVVATRTLHVLILQSVISKLVGADRVRILFSEHSTKERNATFDWVREGGGRVLVSPLAKEGCSINELRAGIIADVVASSEYANQLIGRFLRKKNQDNTASVAWFVDRQHRTYRRGCMKLFKRLSEIRGYRFCHPVVEPNDIERAVVFESGRGDIKICPEVEQ